MQTPIQDNPMLRHGAVSLYDLCGSILLDITSWSHTTMSNVDRIYSDTRALLLELCVEQGFSAHTDEKSGPFGSRYLELHCENKAVRFLWDGREGWFLLGYCPDLSVEPSPNWEDLYFQKVDIRRADTETYDEVGRTLSASIEELKRLLEGG